MGFQLAEGRFNIVTVCVQSFYTFKMVFYIILKTPVFLFCNQVDSMDVSTNCTKKLLQIKITQHGLRDWLTYRERDTHKINVLSYTDILIIHYLLPNLWIIKKQKKNTFAKLELYIFLINWHCDLANTFSYFSSFV